MIYRHNYKKITKHPKFDQIEEELKNFDNSEEARQMDRIMEEKIK